MRKFKTAAKNRTNYIYYTAEGKPIVITPGMVGEDGKAVTESLITMLHDWDDDDVDKIGFCDYDEQIDIWAWHHSKTTP